MSRCLRTASAALLAGFLVCLLQPSAAAQALPQTAETADIDEAEAQALELGTELLARHGVAPRAPYKRPSPRAAALDALALARGRAEALAVLIRWDPDRALAAAFPQEALRELRTGDPRLAPHLEERGSWEGPAAAYVADDFEKRRAVEFHVLDTPQGRLEAYGVPEYVRIRNGDRIAVSGIALRNRIAVQGARPLSAVEPQARTQEPGLYPTAENCASTGEQKTAVFLVYKRGTEPPSLTAAQLREQVFGPRYSLDRYVRTVSFGRARLSGEVFGPLEIDDVTAPLDKIADAAGLTDLSRFSRYMTIGRQVAPGVGGSSSLGCEPLRSSLQANLFPHEDSGADRLSQRLLIHEFGHSLGLHHAKMLRMDGEMLGPVSSVMNVEEYGDRYDPMGSGSESYFFNARHLLGIGWLDPDNVVNIEGEGTFNVKLLDDGSPPDSPVAVRIRRRSNSDEWLWLEAVSAASPLTAQGFSARDPAYADTALVRFEAPSIDYAWRSATYLLDPSPDDHHRGPFAMPLGKTWNDPYSLLSLTVESVSPAGLTVRVERGTDCFSVSPVLRTYSYFRQEGVFEITAPAGCAWQARSDSNWVELDAAAASGSGPSQVRYALHGHMGNGDRLGNIYVGRQAHVVVQQSNPLPPILEELTPRSGSGSSQVFRVTFSDPNAPREGLRSELARQELEIRDGDALRCRPYFCFTSGNCPPYGDDLIFTAADCSVDWDRSSVTFAAGKAVAEYHIDFRTNSRNVLQVKACVRDRSGLSDCQTGSWVVASAAQNMPPAIVAERSWGHHLPAPSVPGTFRGDLWVEDPDGAFDVVDASVEIVSRDRSKWCVVTGFTADDGVALTGPDGVLRAPRDGGPLENAYCTVVPPSVNRSFWDGRNRFRFGGVYFSKVFSGAKAFRFTASDRTGHRTYTEYKDIYDSGERYPTLPGAVSPASGSGRSQRFEWMLLHPEGGGSAGWGSLAFRSASTNSRCDIDVSGDRVRLGRYVRDGDPETEDWLWSDWVRIGTNVILENDTCSIDVSGMESRIAGNARSLSATIGFEPAFAGPFVVTVRTQGISAAVRGVWRADNPGGVPWIAGLSNTASLNYGHKRISPGEVVTIFGDGLGAETTIQARADSGGDMPKEIAGTRVLFDGLPAPLLSVGGMRVEAVTPYTQSSPKVIVERNGVASNAIPIWTTATKPGLFARDGSGLGQALAVHSSDGSLNGPENPAPKGSVLVLYATGLGETDPLGIDGRIAAAGVLPRYRTPVSVIVGNRAAEALYAGGAPGLTAGIAQINARIGESTPSGSHIPIALIAGDGGAEQFLTVAVE